MIFTEADRDRFFELAYAWGADGTEQWRSEIKKRLDEQEARAKQAAKDNPTKFGVRRVETVSQVMGGTLMPVRKAVENFSVAENELGAFAKYIGARGEDLLALVRGEQAELVLKTGIWMAWTTPTWSASKDFRDRTEELRERADLEEEDEHVRNWLEKWNANKQSIYQPEEGLPVAIEWSKQKASKR